MGKAPEFYVPPLFGLPSTQTPSSYTSSTGYLPPLFLLLPPVQEKKTIKTMSYIYIYIYTTILHPSTNFLNNNLVYNNLMQITQSFVYKVEPSGLYN